MTLTQVASFTHKFVIIFILVIVLGVSGFIGYRIWYASYLASLPPVEIQPDVSWGVLPAPELTNTTTVSPTNYSYSVDTVTGNLPTFDKLTQVFFMPKSVATLLSADRSRNIADKLNLKVEPNIISPTLYEYKEGSKQLAVDLDSGNFKYIQEATNSAVETIVQPETALVDGFKDLLSKMDVLSDSIKNGPSKVNYFRYQDEELVITTNPAEAQAAEILLWPANLTDKPILTTPFNNALIKAIVVNSSLDPNNYLSIDYTYWPVDETSFSTYPIKTADQALLDLKSGQGVVTVSPINPNVSLTSVYLAYFQSEKYTPYLQPIYVFEGPGFVAYVPAIAPQYLSTTP